MATNESRLIRAARKLDERAPVDPLIVRIVWHDALTGEDELAGVIQMTWGDDDNGAALTRYDAQDE